MSENKIDNVVVAYIGLGSNLENPAAQVHSAMTALEKLRHTQIEACSSLYTSAPVGITAQPDFVNAACRLHTALPVETLLQELLAIEQAHGRRRDGAKGGPRSLDLDILLYGEKIVRRADLCVPHPRLHERAFVLYPLLELDPKLVIPGRGQASDFLAACAGQRVSKTESG